MVQSISRLAKPRCKDGHTVLCAPAAEILIEIECGCTMTQLDIGQPLRYNIEHS